MKKTVTILLASLLTIVVGCVSTPPLTSMRGSDVAAPDKASAELKYRGAEPGSQQRIARTFAQQPPLIPHAVADDYDIKLTENTCLDCHGPENFVTMGAPKLGDSHFVAGSKTLNEARYVCISCHVQQVDAPALVENRFIGNLK